jgi:Tfp pilus assembly protein PilV
MKEKSQNYQNGFSLIEIVLLIVLLGISIPPLANLMKSNLMTTGKLSNVSNATFCARQRMEQIISDYTSQGYAYITTSGRYLSRTDQNITTTVAVTTSTWSGQNYAQVTVTASVPNLTNSISLVVDLPGDLFP